MPVARIPNGSGGDLIVAKCDGVHVFVTVTASAPKAKVVVVVTLADLRRLVAELEA